MSQKPQSSWTSGRNSDGQLHASPFIRWAGGKRRLAHTLMETFPQDFDSRQHAFFEPFLGGGALTFALGNMDHQVYVPGKKLRVSDMNPDLVETYMVVKDSVEKLIRRLRVLEDRIDEENYYVIRRDIPNSPVNRAARFIYLNKTCYNGLWRVNSDGLFNVPFDKAKTRKANLFSEENLIACSKRLQGASIKHVGFEKAAMRARRGDLVYFDPPYIPLTPTSSFSAYSKEGFGEEQHRQLADVIAELTKRGVYVLFSNSDTPLTRQIFRDCLILRSHPMRRSMSADGNNRKDVNEILGMNYSHLHGSLVGEFTLVSKPKDRTQILQ